LWTPVAGKARKKTMFVTAYRVCARPLPTLGDISLPLTSTANGMGLTTASMQQYLVLSNLEASNCNPREAFITYLRKQIDQWTTEPKHDVVLSIDANETLQENINGPFSISSLVSQCGLIDVLDYMHPQDTPPPTIIDSGLRINFLFCTARILPIIIRCGMVPKDSIYLSDH
jgi:hypothetical protein